MSQRLLSSIRKSSLETIKNVGHMTFEIRAEFIVEKMQQKIINPPETRPSYLPPIDADS